MRIQAYTAYAGTLVTMIATVRPEATASIFFTGATIHEDWTAKVRAAMKEHKHVGETSLAYPAASRLQTYFPATGTLPYYALRELRPAGSPRDIDQDFMLEITRLRYEFTLNLLPGAFAATEPAADAIERAMEFAVYSLFAALAIPNTNIPGDNAVIPPEGTYISTICELGSATARTGVEIAAP